jgi:hypothetical protein
MKKAILIPLVTATVAAVAVLGLIHLNRSAEYGRSTATSALHSAATVSAPASTALSSVTAMSASESVTAAADSPPAQYDTWRQEMKTGCASGSPALKTEHFDVNNDDLADTICWRTIKTKNWGDFVDLETIVKTRAGKAQTAYIILGVSASEQQAICGEVDDLSVKQGKWTSKDFNEMGWDYIGPLSINIEGSDCDPPWLFWPKDAKGDEVEFDFERM